VFLYIHPRLAPCGSLNQQTARLDGVEFGTVELAGCGSRNRGLNVRQVLSVSGAQVLCQSRTKPGQAPSPSSICCVLRFKTGASPGFVRILNLVAILGRAIPALRGLPSGSLRTNQPTGSTRASRSGFLTKPGFARTNRESRLISHPRGPGQSNYRRRSAAVRLAG